MLEAQWKGGTSYIASRQEKNNSEKTLCSKLEQIRANLSLQFLGELLYRDESLTSTNSESDRYVVS